jgi:hypothetical protein
MTVDCSHLDSIQFTSCRKPLRDARSASRAAIGGCTCACANRAGTSAAAMNHPIARHRPRAQD